MKFHKINLNYIKFLHQYDNRVQYNPFYDVNKNENRPYIGVVLNINGNNYFAPLEHPRPSHKQLKNNLHIFKINNGNMGIIGLNNMIPVPEQALISFDINKDRNKKILVLQYVFCKKHWSEITDRAKKVYNKRTISPNKFDKKYCCDFKLLEQAYLEYCKINNLSLPETALDKSTEEKSFHYLRVTADEADQLRQRGIKFEGKISLSGKSVIKLQQSDVPKAKKILKDLKTTDNLHKK